MTDTMELLEAIGQDASLRHATADALGDMLDTAEASDALKAAVASGDSAWLAQEFGTRVVCGSQSSQTYPEKVPLPTPTPVPGEDETPDTPEEPDASPRKG
ncbi:hypothetical protein SAMN04487785_114122 [Dyella jiangningensis]|uniref:hypothetical protein n=1 Tax=Dyella sp. AtDHG13 TaxID=1938897 RepID=UPI0008911F02|nr:hypothetical protein [Dyella sp. AtDHG13]PXV54100.1 hypothetical protein BDW41_11352 [Dyella sp. AtDHG13]SDL08062.1 hypothetical protein SAMN04487785_114122 [Dyella jiangningensis]